MAIISVGASTFLGQPYIVGYFYCFLIARGNLNLQEGLES